MLHTYTDTWINIAGQITVKQKAKLQIF